MKSDWLLMRVTNICARVGNARLTTSFCTLGMALLVVHLGSGNAVAATNSAFDTLDTLDRALAPTDSDAPQIQDNFDIFAGDQISNDSNLYRLPASAKVATLVGRNATRSDNLNSASAGLESTWVTGSRQAISLDLRAADNRYFRNSDLDNISSDDKLVWNWGLGGKLSGELGADYMRSLAAFTNTNVYARNIIDRSEYFGAARYQMGPRWALFGGAMYANTSLTAAASSVNDSHTKSVDFGIERATSISNTIGADYRYTDARFPNNVVLEGVSFDPDFREARARIIVKYVISDKSVIEVSGGYLKRDYPSTAIGAFSGDIGRGLFQWQATDKTQLLASAWRELQSDLTAQTDYFVSQGESITANWAASEKFTLSLIVSRDDRNYIGSNEVVISVTPRRDIITAEQAGVAYMPSQSLTVNVTLRYENRDSNQAEFEYADEIASAGFVFKF